MKELSLNILDIAQNSVKAGARNISILISEDNNTFSLRISDDGCGIKEEQLKSIFDPFFTSRTTRKVGLGIPFLKLAAEQTGGHVKIESIPSSDNSENHGTDINALFYKKHIDFTPLGDIISTVITLLQGNPSINFYFTHSVGDKEVSLSTPEMKAELGNEVPLNNYEVLEWVREYLQEQYNGI